MALRQGGTGRSGRRPRSRPGEPGATGEPVEQGTGRAAGREAEPSRDPVEQARQICLDQLGHAPRTRAELAAVLARRGVPAEAAEQVLGRLTEVGMIDDALFAHMWVSSRHRGRGLAGRALSQELRRKGVDDEVVREAVDTLDADQQLATARQLVARRLPASRGLAPDARVRRLAGLLARKGYPAATAFRVVREALAAEGVDPDLVPDLADD